MLGYIEPNKGELKINDLETYNGYYCGLCKEVAENYGQISRLWLSNDMAFLAVFLGALSDAEDHIEYQHCIVHPFKKKPVEVQEQAVKYASDMMIILRAEKHIDDYKDGEKSHLSGKLTMIPKKYEKAANMHPEEAKTINESLQKLYSYEVKGKSNVREMSMCFGQVMKAVFAGFALPDSQRAAVENFADNLGRWLYLIDIIDDFQEDLRERRFNPLVDLDITDVNLAREMIEPALYYYLDELVKAYDLIDFKKNKEILDNIIYLGLRRRTERLLKGEDIRNDQDSI